MTNVSHFFNDQHRKWNWSDLGYNTHICETCGNIDANDAKLEFLLRFRIRNLIQTEDDNFERLFLKYEGIEFTPPTAHESIQHLHWEEIVNHFIRYKLTLGVGIYVPHFSDKINETLRQQFCIPILCQSKMWQLLFCCGTTRINYSDWKRFKPVPLKCLICHDYPFGLYPGNFIVNQNILYMKMFIWMDKNRLHIYKKQNKVIMYKGSKIITWPFLMDAMSSLKEQDSINHLGNMAIFTPGDIFTSFIDIVINRIQMIENQNFLITKIQHFRNDPVKHPLTLFDLCVMYKHCRKKKKYEIDTQGTIISIKKQKKNVMDKVEESILSIIFSKSAKPATLDMVNWFKYPKTKVNINTAIVELGQMIAKGEIDTAITQTSVLNKEYTAINETMDVQNYRPNVDVYRIGRFNKNADTNFYTTLCGIACGIQKVLPRDSKAVEPKKITKSEIGFIDLLNTPDSPRNCGLVLETVLDTVVASFGTTIADGGRMLRTLLSPDVVLVTEPEQITHLDEKYIYICANQTLYRFTPQIPVSLTQQQLEGYIKPCYGAFNFFRMAQYALKIHIPCVELLKESDNFWVCTSTPRLMYKLHADGLLYTTREMEYFEYDKECVETLLIENKVQNNKSFLELWIGREMREGLGNIFGPSVRCTPRPNIHHLPRVSHACSSSKHAICMLKNSRMVGSLHQKNITYSFYGQSQGRISQPGFFPLILVAGGFNNQEDGIVVRKAAIDRGLFLGNTIETATIKVNSPTGPTFTQTVKHGEILRRGQQIGWFRNVSNAPNIVENFSSELILEWVGCNGAKLPKEDEEGLLSVVWVGKDYRCERVDVADIKRMNQLKVNVMYSYLFKPTVGDKLQTPTSQKGVITQLLLDQDTPYVKLDGGECVLPDMIINPHFLKRQSLDIINIDKKYMENCFGVHDAKSDMEIGDKLYTGVLMNPITGLPYIKPVLNPIPGKKYYYPPTNAFVDEDGFACISKTKTTTNKAQPHELVRASLYRGNYFCVNNHNTNIFYSKYGEDVIKTEFTKTPVRGKKGGFSTGPQEHLSLSAMGVENFKYDITHFRSDSTNVKVSGDGDDQIIPGSSTFLRGNDDLNIRNLDVSYELDKLTFAEELMNC